MGTALAARPVGLADREAALRFLSRDAIANLFLLDLAANLGKSPRPGEPQTEIVAAWRKAEIVGVVGLHPTVILDANVGREAVEVFIPYLERIRVGLVKSPVPTVDLLWKRLVARRARRVIIDRIETAYALHPRDSQRVERTAADALPAGTHSNRSRHRILVFRQDKQEFTG